MFQFFKSKNLRVGTIGSIIIKFSSAIFSLLNGILLARLLGLEGFGIYVIGFTTATILSIPANLGLPELIVRYVSKYNLESKHGEIRGLLTVSNRFVLFSSLVIFVLAGLGIYFFKSQLVHDLKQTLLLSLLLVPVLGYSALRAATLRGYKYILLSEIPDTLLRNGLFLLLISYYFFSDKLLLPQGAILLQIVATCISFGIGHSLLHRNILRKLKGKVKVFHKKEWLTQAVPFSLNSGIQTLKGRFMTYIIPIFSSVESVAVYEVALRGASLVVFTLSAINSSILPYISIAYEKKDFVSLQVLIRKASRLTFAFALPTAIIFLLFGNEIIPFLFGESYIDSYLPLIVLIFGYLVHSYTGAAGSLLNMTGRQAYLTKNQLQMLITTVIISIPLVFFYNALGAAISVSMVLIIQNIILVRYVKKELNIKSTVF